MTPCFPQAGFFTYEMPIWTTPSVLSSVGGNICPQPQGFHLDKASCTVAARMMQWAENDFSLFFSMYVLFLRGGSFLPIAKLGSLQLKLGTRR